jgi:hypothetical protein
MNDETLKWIFNNGLAVSIIVAIFYGIWAGAKALFTVVLIPMKDAAISLFHSQTENLEEQSTMMRKQGEMMEKQGETMNLVCFELRECRQDIAHIKQRVS